MSRPLLRFAVVADTHVNPRDDESNSPWQVNRWANARTRRILRQVAAEDPAFVVHLGDMVHPVPGTPTYHAAAHRFFELADELTVPMHLVPGNHDAGDKPVDWAPANPINASYLRLYEQTFGSSHYSFDHDDVHVVVVNTMLVNSGLDAESTQRAWLEDDLSRHATSRTFVVGHYPLYLTRPDEPECYDNVGEPGRTWLLDLFAQHHVEAYLAGHVHNFFFNHHEGTDHYILPSTSFVRHDYSELARIEPGPQFGRDDADKLGYMIIDVHEHGHAAHIVRSDDAGRANAVPPPRVAVRQAGAVPVGMDMRDHWAEPVPLPYNGMLDEFVRRTVRNDYPLLALWELGVQALRVPLHDLVDPVLADRMRALGAVGHRFHVFSYDIPTGRARAALARCADSLSGLEIILAPDAFAGRQAAVAELRAATGLPITVSPLITSAHAAHTEEATARFAHHVRHGFDPHGDITTLGADGVAYRVPADGRPWDDIRAAGEVAARHGVRATVHVTLAGEDPATDTSTDATTATRVAETLFAAWSCRDNVLVFLDTLADVDRGYFPRRGLIDRRFNPRLAGSVYRHLHAALTHATARPASAEMLVRSDAGSVWSADGGRLVLILPTTEIDGQTIADHVAVDGPATIVDLTTGVPDAIADPGDGVFTMPVLLTRR